ncbi:sigma-70 family RNA polymerase sigma factor [Agaribacter marinus]|uniref:RNA polymerase sigma factor n=1 Tax=Agaribacter marinus TaxID=1431249 RepID=A0AA37T1E2_9ALTE|nr:sigma-70 family RNA polymerase sigma factor [Agaribacter marinus]GLR72174.1 RNA polymerase sigma factor [Agaribacter marinus]
MIDPQPPQLEELLARCALNDQAAFAQLYKKVASKLNGIAYRILNNVDSANEVLQEAFVQIWNNASEYRQDKAEPMTWMASIVRYRAYDRIKFEKRRIEGAQIKADIEGFDDIADKRTDGIQLCEIDQQLTDCLADLDVNQRKSVLMAYYYGFSREEISSQFEAPINTVKSWIRRGIERLQQCLGN